MDEVVTARVRENEYNDCEITFAGRDGKAPSSDG